MQFWHDLQTQKSFEVLMKLKKEFDFILIGGWAVYLYTKALKSKDIDLIISYDSLEKFKTKYNLAKNERLKKYEAKIEDIAIDVYAPFYSNPGIPAEEITGISREGFRLPALEMLLILKQAAYRERVGSIRGEKDKLDIISILKTGVDFNRYFGLLKRHKKSFLKEDLVRLLKNTKEAKELELNQNAFSRLKKKFLKELEP